MVTAAEMYEKAKRIREQTIQDSLNYVESQIQKEAEKCKFETTVFCSNGSYPYIEEIEEVLVNNGYSVEYIPATQRDSAELKISWKEAIKE